MLAQCQRSAFPLSRVVLTLGVIGIAKLLAAVQGDELHTRPIERTPRLARHSQSWPTADLHLVAHNCRGQWRWCLPSHAADHNHTGVLSLPAHPFASASPPAWQRWCVRK